MLTLTAEERSSCSQGRCCQKQRDRGRHCEERPQQQRMRGAGLSVSDPGTSRFHTVSRVLNNRLLINAPEMIVRTILLFLFWLDMIILVGTCCCPSERDGGTWYKNAGAHTCCGEEHRERFTMWFTYSAHKEVYPKVFWVYKTVWEKFG